MPRRIVTINWDGPLKQIRNCKISTYPNIKLIYRCKKRLLLLRRDLTRCIWIRVRSTISAPVDFPKISLSATAHTKTLRLNHFTSNGRSHQPKLISVGARDLRIYLFAMELTIIRLTGDQTIGIFNSFPNIKKYYISDILQYNII